MTFPLAVSLSTARLLRAVTAFEETPDAAAALGSFGRSVELVNFGLFVYCVFATCSVSCIIVDEAKTEKRLTLGRLNMRVRLDRSSGWAMDSAVIQVIPALAAKTHQMSDTGVAYVETWPDAAGILEGRANVHHTDRRSHRLWLSRSSQTCVVGELPSEVVSHNSGGCRMVHDGRNDLEQTVFRTNIRGSLRSKPRLQHRWQYRR